MTITPAYGRDYKSKTRLLADLLAGRDFLGHQHGSPWDGKPVNLDHLRKTGVVTVTARYDRLRKVARLPVPPPAGADAGSPS